MSAEVWNEVGKGGELDGGQVNESTDTQLAAALKSAFPIIAIIAFACSFYNCLVAQCCQKSKNIKRMLMA